jgi:hypothetical protein
LDGKRSHRAMVQPKSPFLVLFYDQAQRIYPLTPATGAIPIHQAWWEPRSMQKAQIEPAPEPNETNDRGELS